MSSQPSVLRQLQLLAKQFNDDTEKLEQTEACSLFEEGAEAVERVGQAKRDLSDCLDRIRQQQKAAEDAAEAVRHFYEAWRLVAEAEAERIKQRKDDLDSYDEPKGLRTHASERREEADAMEKLLELFEMVKGLADLFDEVQQALECSRKGCADAEERAEVMEQEMAEAANRENARHEAERQRRAEEDRRRKEEEDRERQKEEERLRQERERQEEEERRRQELKRQEEERRRRERERQEEEERERQRQRQREEAESDKRWEPVVFEADGGEFDFPYGCAVRAPEAVHKDAFRCEVLRMEDVDFSSIPATEEIVGNVVRFESAGLSEMPLSLRTKKKYWLIMVPHCAQRMSSRETVIYSLQGDSWVECPSVETHIDNLEHQTRWVETRITEPQATVVAVNKLKTDRISVGKGGIRYSSSVDSRVSINIPEDAIKIQLDQTLEVQPIDSATLAAVRAQHPKDTANLLSTSSIIQHMSIKKNAIRPMTFSFPLPLNPLTQKKARPGTAMPAQSRQAEANRPKTAAPLPTHSEEDEHIILVGTDGERGSPWSVIENAELEQETGKDLVSYKTQRIRNRRFIALRTGPEFNQEVAPRLCAAIETSLEEKTATLIMRQKSDNLTEVIVGLVATHRLERAMKNVNEMGYDYEDSVNAMKELKVRERQKFNLSFRGNIVAVSDHLDDSSNTLVFNSQLKNLMHITVSEKDRFAQRALDQYRGFLDFHTEVPKASKEPRRPGQEVAMEEVRIASLLVNIPKSEEDLRVKSPRTTPFTFKPKDSVTMQYLKELAERVGDRWELLADNLDIDKKRCSVIKGWRDMPEQQAFEMLLTWVKRQQVSKKKAPALYRALLATNLVHLAEDLREQEQESRRESARLRESRSAGRAREEQPRHRVQEEPPRDEEVETDEEEKSVGDDEN